MSKIICRYCNDCKQKGKMQDQKFRLGRKKYYCENLKVKEMKDRHGLPLNNFIGFGETTKESPLALKTSPRWCPKKAINFTL